VAFAVGLLGVIGTGRPAHAASGGAVTSDDFHEGLDTSLWTVTNPNNAGSVAVVGSGTSDVEIGLTLPGGGAEHDAWNTDNALRLMQPVGDTDFTTEAKFSTVPTKKYQTEGLIFQQDAANWLRFDVHSSGTALQGFIARTSAGVSSTLATKTVAAGGAVYIRVARAGSSWTLSYSSTGSSWTALATVSSTLTLSQVGPFAANSGSPVPGWTADVDYVFDTAHPISPEDGGSTTTGTPPVITIWYGDTQTFGQNGQSQKWVNILGNASASGGLASLTYSVNGGSTHALNVGPDLRRLVAAGDFNADIDYASFATGANTVTIVATDKANLSTTHVVTVNKVVASGTLPFNTAWSTRSKVSDAVQVSDGQWVLTGGGLRNTEIGYDRTIDIGDVNWSNYEVTVPFTMNGIGGNYNTPESNAPALGLGIYWLGHTQRVSGEQPLTFWYPTGAYAWYQFKSTTQFQLNGNNNLPLKTLPASLPFGTQYIWKLRAQTVSGGVQYSFKQWKASDAEPAAWTMQITGTTGPKAGAIVLVAHHVDVTYGDITVASLNGSTPVPVNTAAPAISGTAKQGQTLSASTGTWTNSPTAYAYQWNRCAASCSSITGATASSYTAVAADVGDTLNVSVTASNAGGPGAAATSAMTATVAGTASQIIAAGTSDTNLPTENKYAGAQSPPYVCCWGSQGQYVTFTFTTSGGVANLGLRYSAGGGVASRTVELDGAVLNANQSFAATTSWSTWKTLTLSPTLTAGTHTLKVWFDSTAGSSKFINLDNLTVS
jgi:regulation of enolase protein 1 (concanavalin A-like superfamily)